MSPVMKTNSKASVGDAQAMRWVRTYYKAADGEQWLRPTRWSQLVKIVDLICDEMSQLQRAVRMPLEPGAADLILRMANEDVLGASGWTDDYGQPVDNACLAYYAEAFGWAARGAKRTELAAIEGARREREEEIQVSIASMKQKDAAAREQLLSVVAEREQKVGPIVDAIFAAEDGRFLKAFLALSDDERGHLFGALNIHAEDAQKAQREGGQ
jgi:hypothetical protein